MYPIVFLCGVSGAGKGMLRDMFVQKNPDLVRIVPSYSSRAMRPGEKQGDPYVFVTRDAFLQEVEAGGIIEYNEYVSNLYGTHRDLLYSVQDEGYIPMKEIDINGLMSLVNNHTLKRDFVTIFLTVDNETMRARIQSRGDDVSLQQQEERIVIAQKERDMAREYCDLIIDATQSPLDVYREALAYIQQVATIE